MATIDMPVREAINSALDEELGRDDNVFLIGNEYFILVVYFSLCVGQS